MNADTTKIAKRVKKMLDLATSTSFAKEAETAMRMARSLMAKHNLSMDEVMLAADAIRPNVYENSNTRPWVRSCYRSAAKMSACDYIYGNSVSRGKCQHIFVGLPHNTAVAYLMGGYLINAIRRMCKEQVRSMKTCDPQFKTSFYIAASVAIQNRVNELIAQRATQPNGNGNGNGKDLVIMSTLYDRALAWTADNLKTRETKARRTRLSEHGVIAGKEAGDNISLHSQIK